MNKGGHLAHFSQNEDLNSLVPNNQINVWIGYKKSAETDNWKNIFGEVLDKQIYSKNNCLVLLNDQLQGGYINEYSVRNKKQITKKIETSRKQNATIIRCTLSEFANQ